MYKQVKLFRNVEPKQFSPDKSGNSEINQFLKSQGKYIITVHPVANEGVIDILVEYYVHEKQSKESVEAFTQ